MTDGVVGLVRGRVPNVAFCRTSICLGFGLPFFEEMDVTHSIQHGTSRDKLELPRKIHRVLRTGSSTVHPVQVQYRTVHTSSEFD